MGKPGIVEPVSDVLAWPIEDVPDAVGALEFLPLAAVVLDVHAGSGWANAAARALAPTPEGLTRLLRTVASSAAVADAEAKGAGASAVIRLATHRGVVEREVWAAPMPAGPDRPALVVATFPADLDVRTAGTADEESVGRLEAMLAHTVDIITVLDRDGKIVFSNAAAGALTGFTGDGVSGQAAFDFIHPDDVERAATAFVDALAQPGPSPSIELRLRFADGTWHDVDVVVNNLLDVATVDGLVVTLHEITDRKAAERLVADNAEKLRSLVENLTDVIVVLDGEFQVTYASPAIAKIIDAPPESNLGRSAFNDVHPEDLPAVIDALTTVAAAAAGSSVRVDLRLEESPGSGRWRWIDATAVNRLADTSVSGIVVTLRDVTEQRAAADELRAAYERERDASERLRELDRLKDAFLATVSHELRTPLSVIVGFSDLLERPNLEPAIAGEAVARIRACAAEMRGMVENLLAFSALEAGKVTVRPEAMVAVDLITTAVARLRPLLAEHDVAVDVPAGLVLVADPDAVEAVVRNLLTNAAKYSEAGSPILVRGREVDATVVLDFEDHGVGIDADQLDHIFERLYRAPGAAFAGRGTGVGLNAARRYTELMGGRLTVESMPGSGSVFTVTLPSAVASSR